MVGKFNEEKHFFLYESIIHQTIKDMEDEREIIAGNAGEENPPPATPPVEKSGRDLFIEKYRGYHPDSPDELDDNDLWNYAGSSLAERDDYMGKYDTLNQANDKLAAVVGENPEVAQFISMIANGEPPLYAIGKSFGDIESKIDEESLEQMRKGREEYRKEVQRIKDNVDRYQTTLKNYGETNGLSEENLASVNDIILDIAEALREGDIPEELIDSIWKGMDYESATTANIEAAKLAGKNEAIEDIKSKKQNNLPPDVSAKKSQGSAQPKKTTQSTPPSGFEDFFKDAKPIY